MSPDGRRQANQLANALAAFRGNALPGAATDERRLSLAMQMVEGARRVSFVESLRDAEISQERATPGSSIFDPLRAAVLRARDADIDEACWLVFLATHFGKSQRSGWRMVSDTYGAFGNDPQWTWDRVRNNLGRFSEWAIASEGTYRGGDGVRRSYSNHRQYETFKMTSNRGLPQVVASYVQWVGANRGHAALFAEAQHAADGNPAMAFDILYRSMEPVVSFGRLGRFDYLTMVGKLGLTNIEPGSPYLKGATGPERGARLLFDGAPKSLTPIAQLDAATTALGNFLNLRMQVMEDAICNWQKSPDRFLPFRG